MQVRRGLADEGVWIKPHCEAVEQPWPQREGSYHVFMALHRPPRSFESFVAVRNLYLEADEASAEAPIGRSELTLLDRKIDEVRKALRLHEAEARKRTEFLLQIAGIPDVTPAEIDGLADQAYSMLSRGDVTDPIAFAERTGIDIRVAGLVFRRLIQQDRIEEA